MDSEAKKLFEKWMNEEIGGMKRKDLAILIALLHDCGKILSYREDNKVSTLITSKPILEGQTLCPGHEYWGGEIVAPEILKELGIGENIIDFILQVIKFHDALGYVYLTGKENYMYDNTQGTSRTDKDMNYSLKDVYKACPKKIVADCTLFNKCQNSRPFTAIAGFNIQPQLLTHIEKECKIKYSPQICTEKLCIAYQN